MLVRLQELIATLDFRIRPSTISLFITHRWLPKRRRRVIEIAPGIALTFVSCIAFGQLFGAYLSEFARSYVSTYAGLASVMVALIFLYSRRRSSFAAANSTRRSCGREKKRDRFDGELRGPVRLGFN